MGHLCEVEGSRGRGWRRGEGGMNREACFVEGKCGADHELSNCSRIEKCEYFDEEGIEGSLRQYLKQPVPRKMGRGSLKQ
jgi:hypothetical protein